MKGKILHSSAPVNRSVASSVRRDNPASQLKPRISFSPPAPVFQRVGEAFNSIEVKDKKEGGKVPELDETTEEKLASAKKKKGERKDALLHLYQYLKNNNAIDSDLIDNNENKKIELKIKYVNETPKENLAITQFLSSEKKASITITVYASLFKKSLPVIYSAFRHELIHAAQLSNEADDINKKDDPYIYGTEIKENETEVIGGIYNIKKKGEYKYHSKYVNHPLREIETHCWEINNMKRTGVSTEKMYMNETYDWIGKYAGALTDWLKHKDVEPETVKQYGGYIEKGIDYMENLQGNTPETITKALTELKEAYRMKKNLENEESKNKKTKKVIEEN